MKTRIVRGDLSGPMLALIITLVIVAAGLIILAWFWYFAPSAGKSGTLQILGAPAITSDGTLYISVRNPGNDAVVINGIAVNNVRCQVNNTADLNISVAPGQDRALVLTCPGAVPAGAKAVNGVIMTSYGTFQFGASVI